MAHLKPTYVHLVRFGEAIELVKERMDRKNVYLTNPAFDSGKNGG